MCIDNFDACEVTGIQEGSAAEAAGLMRGDVITMVNEMKSGTFGIFRKRSISMFPETRSKSSISEWPRKNLARTASISRVVNHSIEEADGEGLRRQYRVDEVDSGAGCSGSQSFVDFGQWRSSVRKNLVRWFRNVARDLPARAFDTLPRL